MQIRKATPDYYARLLVPIGSKGHWHRDDVPPFTPHALARGVFVEPFVNEARWLVGCPGCGGAQLAAPDCDRFFCIDCLNAWIDGQWLAVNWPNDHADIDEALGYRRATTQANWNHEQSVAELWAENVFHGAHKWDRVPDRHLEAAREAWDRMQPVKLADHLVLNDGTIRTTLTAAGRAAIAAGTVTQEQLEQAGEQLAIEGK